MTPTRQIHDAGQSIWLDDISRDPSNEGPLERYIDELPVTRFEISSRYASPGKHVAEVRA